MAHISKKVFTVDAVFTVFAVDLKGQVDSKVDVLRWITMQTNSEKYKSLLQKSPIKETLFWQSLLVNSQTSAASQVAAQFSKKKKRVVGVLQCRW